MAHAARLGQLADDLICSITGRTGKDAHFTQLHDRTLRGLKNASHARTNQFDVKTKLDGLVEKFSVLNRDDLAEGLQTRLDELPTKSKWLPELLSLLLELSDRPLEKTRLEDVEAVSRVELEEPALTWADIVADEPLDEAHIWDDVERGYHSSEDDFTGDEHGSGDDTQATSVVEDDPVTLARLHLLPVDSETLKNVTDARQDLANPSDRHPALSELTLIRETLSMLHGLPTNIFTTDRNTHEVTLTRDLKLATASRSILRHTIQQLVDSGSHLNILRAWTKAEQISPTLRSCQAALWKDTIGLGNKLASLEQRYISPSAMEVASIAELCTDVEIIVQPFQMVSMLLRKCNGRATLGTVSLLDELYDAACTAQLSGDSAVFDLVTNMLLSGLQAYLRPVSGWILAGECDSNDDFFVREADGDCELGRLWRDRYTLRRERSGVTTAPSFFRPFVDRVFALGKGRAFIRALTRDEECPEVNAAHSGIDLVTNDDFLPFSENLSSALENWIAEQSRDQAPALREIILANHALLSTVDALQDVFFSKNGRRFQTFADTLFWRLEHSARWADGFLLTELAQSTLGSAATATPESITVQISAGDDIPPVESSSIARLRQVHLQYHFPWPLQNVTGSRHSYTYSRSFTILLQTYRAKHLLRQNIFALRPSHGRTSRLPAETQTALKLHQRLTTIVDILHAHITHTSALLSTRLKNDLGAAEDIDAMASVWHAHEETLAVSLLVAEKLTPIQEAVVGILELGERVAGVLERAATTPDLNRSGEESSDAGEMGPSGQGLQKELDASLSFVVAGLRGIGRAGGNVALEQLAERLEWAVG